MGLFVVILFYAFCLVVYVVDIICRFRVFCLFCLFTLLCLLCLLFVYFADSASVIKFAHFVYAVCFVYSGYLLTCCVDGLFDANVILCDRVLSS